MSRKARRAQNARNDSSLHLTARSVVNNNNNNNPICKAPECQKTSVRIELHHQAMERQVKCGDSAVTRWLIQDVCLSLPQQDEHTVKLTAPLCHQRSRVLFSLCDFQSDLCLLTTVALLTVTMTKATRPDFNR